MKLNIFYLYLNQFYLQNICGDNLNYDLLVCGRKLTLENEKKTIIIFLSNRRLSYQNEVGRLLYPLPSADWPRYQEPDVSKSYTTRRYRPRLRNPWPVQCYRTGTVPLMDILHPSNDLPTGRDIPLEPFRRYEGNSSLSLWTIPFVV